MIDDTATARDAVLAAALRHVPFDGWSETTLRAGIADSGIEPALARALFPRGGLDLAVAFHRQGDRKMTEALAAADLSTLRFREKIAKAVRLRIEAIPDRELIRRGATLFALPQHGLTGSRLVWGTADAIWTALGDSTRDLSWYTKRATLSAVYGATVLYWLGDDSPGAEATWAFLDRRIEDVMKIEKAKAAVRDNPLAQALREGPGRLFRNWRMPRMPDLPDDLPGRMRF
jgi:ubiquinone biosynthesis protein COQ9